MLPASCLLLTDSKSKSSTLFPSSTTTRVSSGWVASISIFFDIDVPEGASADLRSGRAPGCRQWRAAAATQPDRHSGPGGVACELAGFAHRLCSFRARIAAQLIRTRGKGRRAFRVGQFLIRAGAEKAQPPRTRDLPAGTHASCCCRALATGIPATAGNGTTRSFLYAERVPDYNRQCVNE